MVQILLFVPFLLTIFNSSNIVYYGIVLRLIILVCYEVWSNINGSRC